MKPGALPIDARSRRQSSFGFLACRSNVDKRDPMMFVIVGQKGHGLVTVLHLALKHLGIPLDHLVQVMGAIYNVREFPGGLHFWILPGFRPLSMAIWRMPAPAPSRVPAPRRR
jgi:hypothetical protein